MENTYKIIDVVCADCINFQGSCGQFKTIYHIPETSILKKLGTKEEKLYVFMNNHDGCIGLARVEKEQK